MPKAGPCKNNASPPPCTGALIQAGVIVLGTLVGVIALALVSPDQLDRLPHWCLWSRLLGHPCPACGTTHALCCLCHGDFRHALSYNRNVIVVAPVLVGVWLGQLRTLRRGLWPPARP